MTAPEKAKLYAAKVPPAVSGQGGHAATYHLACELYNGFALDFIDSKSILKDWNMSCDPPWSDAELDHKIRDAEKARHKEHRGWRVRSSSNDFVSRAKIEALPEPLADGAATLIRAAFLEGEIVSGVGAWLNAGGKSTPQKDGFDLPREWWLDQLAKDNGDPGKRIFNNDAAQAAGAFMRINPIKKGLPAVDANVAAFRHALIEFDTIPIDEQWPVIIESNAPCSAIIHSGGKSLHAWVRVDAKDRSEYDSRVLELLKHFEQFKPDPKNKNPSRLSRMPDARRGESFQRLLAVNIGAKSWDDWSVSKSSTEILRVADLLKFDFENDPNSIIGNRFLCRGHTCLLVGPSGIGKSTLTMQFGVTWAVGQPVFGVTPARPLRSLVVQAENDQGDLAEQIFSTVETNPIFKDKKNLDLLNENMIFVREMIATGGEFVSKLKTLIAIHKPDLVWVDPLLSYIGDDLSDQKVASNFLRNLIAPILEATGVVLFLVHHIRKPSKDDVSKSGIDLQYLATGSADVVNFSRAIICLMSSGDGTADLHFVKRGARAKAQDFKGNFSKKLTIAHSPKGPVWELVAEKSENKNAPVSDDSILSQLRGGWKTWLEMVGEIRRILKVDEKTAKTKFSQIRSEFEIDSNSKPQLYRVL